MENELTSEASWWGSRAWARFGLRSLEPANRHSRLKLIRMISRLKKPLNEIENALTARSVDGISIALVRTLSFGEIYKDSLVPEFKNLIDLQSDEETRHRTKQLEESKPEAKTKPDGYGSGAVPSVEDLEKRLGKSPVERVKEIHKQSSNIQLVIASIVGNLKYKVTEQQNKELWKLYYDLQKEIFSFITASQIKDAPVAIDFDSALVDIETKYNLLFKTCQTIVHKFEPQSVNVLNFDQMLSVIGAPKKVKKKNKKNENPDRDEDEEKEASMQIEFEKFAAGAISRWINKKLLGLSPKIESGLILNAADSVSAVKKLSKELLDALEDPQIGTVVLTGKSTAFRNAIRKMYKDILIPAKLFFWKQDEITVGKGQRFHRMRRPDFRALEVLERDLEDKVELSKLLEGI